MGRHKLYGGKYLKSTLARWAVFPDFFFIESSNTFIAMKTRKRKKSPNYVIAQENGVFVARCPDLGLACRGETEQEALANLEEALALYFEDLPGPADG